MPGSRPVAHQLTITNTQGEPQTAQLLKPMHEFKSSSVRIDAGPFTYSTVTVRTITGWDTDCHFEGGGSNSISLFRRSPDPARSSFSQTWRENEDGMEKSSGFKQVTFAKCAVPENPSFLVYYMECSLAISYRRFERSYCLHVQDQGTIYSSLT
jgi:hypothetical protein